MTTARNAGCAISARIAPRTPDGQRSAGDLRPGEEPLKDIANRAQEVAAPVGISPPIERLPSSRHYSQHHRRSHCSDQGSRDRHAHDDVHMNDKVYHLNKDILSVEDGTAVLPGTRPWLIELPLRVRAGRDRDLQVHSFTTIPLRLPMLRSYFYDALELPKQELKRFLEDLPGALEAWPGVLAVTIQDAGQELVVRATALRALSCHHPKNALDLLSELYLNGEHDLLGAARLEVATPGGARASIDYLATLYEGFRIGVDDAPFKSRANPVKPRHLQGALQAGREDVFVRLANLGDEQGTEIPFPKLLLSHPRWPENLVKVLEHDPQQINLWLQSVCHEIGPFFQGLIPVVSALDPAHLPT